MSGTDNPTEYAPNVVLALCRVMAELPGIGKDQTSPQGYNYRGIEQITVHAQSLFAKHGIVLAPRHVEWHPVVNLQINNRPWTDEKLTVEYRCYGPGGVEDFIDIEVPGIGRDNSDKGANKAMTQAYKYALIQALCIADAKDDADREHHEADAATPAPRAVATQDEADALAAKLDDETQVPAEVAAAFKAWKQDQHVPWPWPRAEYERMLDVLADMLMDDWTSATSPSERPSNDAGGTTPDEAVDERSEQPVRSGETLPSAAEAQAQLDNAKALLASRSKFETRAKDLPLAKVREQLSAVNLDHVGAAPVVRERLVDHWMGQLMNAQKAS